MASRRRRRARARLCRAYARRYPAAWCGPKAERHRQPFDIVWWLQQTFGGLPTWMLGDRWPRRVAERAVGVSSMWQAVYGFDVGPRANAAADAVVRALRRSDGLLVMFDELPLLHEVREGVTPAWLTRKALECTREALGPSSFLWTAKVPPSGLADAARRLGLGRGIEEPG